MGSFSYTPRASISCLRFVSVYVTHREIESVGSFGGERVSLKRPVLESVSSIGGWGVSLPCP